MKITHLLPRRAAGHTTDGPCPCEPTEAVTAVPGAQPAVTLTHRSLPKESR